MAYFLKCQNPASLQQMAESAVEVIAGSAQKPAPFDTNPAFWFQPSGSAFEVECSKALQEKLNMDSLIWKELEGIIKSILSHFTIERNLTAEFITSKC